MNLIHYYSSESVFKKKFFYHDAHILGNKWNLISISISFFFSKFVYFCYDLDLYFWFFVFIYLQKTD